MSNSKETIVAAVVEKFVNTLDVDKKMYILGFMEGIQAERAAKGSTIPSPTPQQKPA